MVDPIAFKGSTPPRQVAPVAAAPVASNVASVAAEPQPQQAQATAAGQLAADLSARPPVDTDRIERIKRAIEDGTFPILPATIADSMLALKYDWLSRDKA
ncbi:MAG: flagellar biosynthesis anti-sigma factor FlgM [Sphingomonas sp.]|uniref:flagellar biosynthesis anti-sigma factor FlgM n=1 Tax=Sphingomonas sp. TaxID=28214 RepID=UPI001AC9D9D3|nr:flagellar biosynthesis anti-sigma factor FlgM [Sphingomonas sp.]MBN8808004.1 flagellar biosynthesis anti-sigma factor FlgM [Sphingomonas sp.]